MDASVETIHNRIMQKIDLLRSIIMEMSNELNVILERMNNRFKNKKAEILSKLPILKEYQDKIKKIESNYSVNAIILLDEEFYEENNETFGNRYRDEVVSSGIINKLDYIRGQLLNFTESLPKLSGDLMEKLINYKNLKVSVKNKKSANSDICEDCKIKMIPYPEESRMECSNCGVIISMPGAVFDKVSCFSQDGQRVRQGSYDPSRHINKWMNNIQAKGRNNIPDEVIKAVNKCAIRDYTRVDYNGNEFLRSMKNMRCKQIRNWLRETNNTKYNDYAPQIRGIITGVMPYQLTYEEEQLVLSRLRLIVDEFARIKSEDGYCNMRYYPYWIFKTIEMSFPKNSKPWSLLECIHLQSEDTLEKNDKIMRKICDRIPGFPKFRKTDRNIINELFY